MFYVMTFSISLQTTMGSIVNSKELMLSHSLKDAKDNLDIIARVSREYGFEINSENSCVMIFNVREPPEHLCNIKVVQKMKYLGIEIDTKWQNYTKCQKNGKYNILCDREKLQQIIDWKNVLEMYSSTITSVWYKYNKFDR